MVVYYSMFVLLFLVFLYNNKLAKKSIVYNNTNDNQTIKTYRTCAFIVFAYIIFWIGIRNAFVDTAAYIRSFNTVVWDDLTKLDFTFGSGWGFKVLEILFKHFISDNYHFWLMFIAIISGTCVAVTFYRYSCNFYYTVFIFLSLTTFTWMMNGIRQFLAVAIIFACTPLIEKKKFLKYTIVVLLCSTIHASCIIMLPVYFISRSKPWKKRTMLVILIALFAVLFADQFTGILDTMLSDTTYTISSDSYLNDDGVNPIRVLVFSITTILAFISKKNVEDNDVVNILINMSIVTTGIYIIGMSTSGIMIGRLPIYTQMYQYILLPYLINKTFNFKDRKIIYILSIACYLLYFYAMSRGFYYSSDFTGRI